MDLFLCRSLHKNATYSDLYEHLRTYSGMSFVKFLEDIGKHNHISYSIHKGCEFDQLQLQLLLQLPEIVSQSQSQSQTQPQTQSQSQPSQPSLSLTIPKEVTVAFNQQLRMASFTS